MQRYDPDSAPDPEHWLVLDEALRIERAEQYHRKAGIQLPNVRAHAAFHAIVENQIALGLAPVVRAMARLRADGLSRHEAIHAVCTALAEHFFELMQSPDRTLAAASQARYEAAVERLDAAEWQRRYG
ncbi:hypothetical protein CKO44_09075 [Rubrivivax gelatinosus]|uniref:hypothetical protein n=1 Tax=Rubrivivax gelatinosus TaxID=28068 RepID=UPI00190469AF|nr:hypothetical protein [Rubrivivax gelatinosus]MBK1613621.1 hypothetical protein [Rubrivivax gelatinosus]MBZ8143762.1 hypothetical protein [Rubrivivax gelatinosus]